MAKQLLDLRADAGQRRDRGKERVEQGGAHGWGKVAGLATVAQVESSSMMAGAFACQGMVQA
jgi:hypothetical protein